MTGFSATLLSHSGTLERVSELQDLVFYWRSMYNYLQHDYAALQDKHSDECTANARMSANADGHGRLVRGKDRLIAFLLAEIQLLQTKVAGQSLVDLARGRGAGSR